jgi:hypothetical protein
MKLSTAVSIALFAVLPSLAHAEPTTPRTGARHSVGVRAVGVTPADGSFAVGGGVDWRMTRGRSRLHAGLAAATSPAGTNYGFIRLEGSYHLDLGPFYAGAGLGTGTLSIGTPDVGTGKWTGAGVAPFVQLGRELDVGGSTLILEARAGACLPFGSIDPMEPVPSARVELGVGAGMRF